MLRTPLAALAAALAAPLAFAAPAAANPVDQAVSALRSSSVYVGASAPKIDQAALRGKLDGIKIAVVPTGGPAPGAVAGSIGQRLASGGSRLTVVVFEGHAAGTRSTAYCGAGSALSAAIDAHRGDLTSSDDVTSTVADFATRLRALPKDSNGCSGGTKPSATSYGSEAKGSSHTGLLVFVIVAVVLALGIGLFVRARRGRRARELSDYRAQVLPLYERLQYEVNNLNPGSNTVAGQALKDARERLASVSNQLAAADSEQKYGQARQTALEGLYAARTARAALGLDPGPPLPPLTGGDVGHLSTPQQVNVQGQSYQGYPSYTPAAPYYFGGGYGIPGGWYGFPFWEGMLLGSVLSGGWGWGWGGWGGGWGGYGAGYDNGYLTGFDAGEQAADDSGASGADGTGSGWGDSGGDVNWGNDGGDSGWGDGGGGGGDWGSNSDGGSW